MTLPVLLPALSLLAFLLVLSGSPVAAAAEEGEKPLPDKSGYSLINPTPKDAMREFNPDRPNKTDSPYTIDAGHIQLEASLVEYTLDDTAGVRTKTWNAFPLSIRAGILNNLELELFLEDYLHVRTRDRNSGTTTTHSGFGDLEVAIRFNVWGNDGGSTAFGIIPRLKIPTNTDGLGNSSVEGGVGLPFAAKLPADLDLEMETSVMARRDQEGRGHHSEFVNSISLSHKLAGELEAYAEFFSIVSTERDSNWEGTVDVGLTYKVARNVQLDCGVNIGVTSSADDYNPFVGMAVRF